MLKLSNPVVRWTLILTLTTFLGLFVEKARAQSEPYRTVKSAIVDSKQVGAARRELRRVLSGGGALSADDQKTLQNFYVRCIFAPMTQPSAQQSPEDYPKWRATVVKDLESVRNRPDVHRFIRDELVVKYLRQLATKNYHPACRYNATLMLGLLNDVEARVNNRVYPLPHAESRAFLIKLMDPRNKQPEVVQLAALISLNRHAGLLRADGQTDNKMIPPLVKIIQSPLPENSLEHDTHYWKKKLAIDTLGDIGLSGAAKTIGGVVSSQEAPLWVRCAAAESIGKLDYSSAQNLNSDELVKGLGQVALAACLVEIERVKKYDAENPQEENRVNLGGFGENNKVEANPAVTEARRTLKHYLACVSKGLSGLESSSAGQSSTLLATVKTQVGAIEQGLDDNPEQTTPQELLERIGPPALELEQAIQ